MITASRDAILTPAMAKGMDQSIPNLQIKEVDANHWAQLERREEVTKIIVDWLSGLKKTSSLL